MFRASLVSMYLSRTMPFLGTVGKVASWMPGRGFGFVQGDSYYTSGDPSCFSKPFFWAAAPDERYAPGRQGRKGRRVFGGARLHVDTDRSIVGRT